MSRKNNYQKREPQPDPKYHDITVTKFVNSMMIDGKRSISEKVFYQALSVAQEKTGEDGLVVFKKAMENVKPALEVKSRRIGGATYQVPIEVKPVRRQSLASRWLVEAARKRGEKSLAERLAAELIEASQGRGTSIKKREDVHKMAEANKAFAHFRW